ncbi:MAG TPA: hypothetical protein VKU90_14845, partial [Caulobacteraceae bacterium]|nr:hypothetical protein [Caulobacteraceae bacterium]
FSLAAGAVALAGAAYADQPPSGVAAPGAPPADAPPVAAAPKTNDPVICEWEEELGSRLGRQQVCKTKSQWRSDSYDAQDQVNDTVRRSLAGSPPGH